MKILGIDPGYAIVGYGTIEFNKNKYFCNDYGAILTSPKDDFSTRIEIIYDKMDEIIKLNNPTCISIEKLYFQNNHKTAIDVAQSRGIIMLCAKKNNIPIFEYTPLQIKNALTGYGKASKLQVTLMVKKLLNLNETPKPDDVADALAIAICHVQSLGYHNTTNLTLKKYR